MRIATWNVQGMAPSWGTRRATLITALQEADAEIVALQECAWRLRHQSTQIARGLQMRAHRAGTLGLVVAARAQTRSRPLPARARGGSKRVLCATIEGVDVWVVHLPLDVRVRERCARAFVAWADETRRPVVVCGDFNERPDAPAATVMRDNGFVDAWNGRDGYTWPSAAPSARIDFVLVRGLRAVSAALLAPEPPASDHLGLVVELE